MGANASHAVASVLPEWILPTQAHDAVLVNEEYDVEIKTVTPAEFHTQTSATPSVTPATPSVTPKTTTVVNTGAPRSNARAKKRKHIDMSEDEARPVFSTEYHGQPRANKRACTVMPTITEEC